MFEARIADLADASLDDLDAALAAEKRARAEADVEIAAISAVIDSRQLFQEHGHRSLRGYLKQQLNCTGAEATRIKRRARLFNQHPDIADTFGESRIALGQVDLLAAAQQHPRVSDQFNEFATLLTEQAERLGHDDFAAAMKHFTVQADHDGAFGDQRFHEDQRTASVRVDRGAVSVHASGGDPLRAAEMKRVFDLAVEAEGQKDFEARRSEHGDDALAHPMPRTLDQRRFDALYEIMIASVAAPADGKRPEPLVNLVVDVGTAIETMAQHGFLDVDVADDALAAGGPIDPTVCQCATSTGVAVHPDVAMKALLAGSVRRVIVDAHNVVVDMGRSQRLFTGKARQAAQLAALTCGHRGCDVPAEFCDVDHVQPWSEGGETVQQNALPLCGPHDRWKHRQRLRGKRDVHGRLHLVRPDGSVIKPLGARDPVWAADAPPPLRSIETTVGALDSQLPERGSLPPDMCVRLVELRPGTLDQFVA